MPADVFARLKLTLLCVRQGEASVEVPIYDADADRLEYYAKRVDKMLLEATGMVLPSREWYVRQSG